MNGLEFWFVLGFGVFLGAGGMWLWFADREWRRSKVAERSWSRALGEPSRDVKAWDELARRRPRSMR